MNETKENIKEENPNKIEDTLTKTGFISKTTSRSLVIVTNKCNNNCIFCLQGNNLHTPNKPLETIFEDIDLIMKSKTNKLVLTGGEPTIHPDFIKILEYINKTNQINHLQIISNGRKFSDENFVKKVKKATRNINTVEISVSIHTNNDKIGDYLAGNIKNAFKETIQGVKNLVKYGFVMSGHVILLKQNTHNLFNTIKFMVEKLKITGDINIIGLEIDGNAVKNYDLIFAEPKEFEKELRKTLEYLDKRGKIAFVLRYPLKYLQGFEKFREHTLKLIELSITHQSIFKNNPIFPCDKKKCPFCRFQFVCKAISKSFKKDFFLFVPNIDLRFDESFYDGYYQIEENYPVFNPNQLYNVLKQKKSNKILFYGSNTLMNIIYLFEKIEKEYPDLIRNTDFYFKNEFHITSILRNKIVRDKLDNDILFDYINIKNKKVYLKNKQIKIIRTIYDLSEFNGYYYDIKSRENISNTLTIAKKIDDLIVELIVDKNNIYKIKDIISALYDFNIKEIWLRQVNPYKTYNRSIEPTGLKIYDVYNIIFDVSILKQQFNFLYDFLNEKKDLKITLIDFPICKLPEKIQEVFLNKLKQSKINDQSQIKQKESLQNLNSIQNRINYLDSNIDFIFYEAFTNGFDIHKYMYFFENVAKEEIKDCVNCPFNSICNGVFEKYLKMKSWKYEKESK